MTRILGSKNINSMCVCLDQIVHGAIFRSKWNIIKISSVLGPRNPRTVKFMSKKGIRHLHWFETIEGGARSSGHLMNPPSKRQVDGDTDNSTRNGGWTGRGAGRPVAREPDGRTASNVAEQNCGPMLSLRERYDFLTF